MNVKTLLAENRTDKEIAQRLGVNLNLIRKDVAFIRKELGFDNRRDTGWYLAQTLGAHGVPGTSGTLSDPIVSPSLVTPAEEAGYADRVMEERAIYIAHRQSPDIGLPYRNMGGTRNELSIMQRSVWIVLLASLSFSAMGVLALALNAVR